MPAASISNGHTGPLRPAKRSEVAEYLGIVAAGAGSPPEALPTFEAAQATAGQRLHVCELWMPGPCNLRCKHCYVAAPRDVRPLSADDFATITTRLVGAGLVDVVIPGMEPLLRDETWSVASAARDCGARSIGMTTNATLLERKLDRVLGSGLTVLNVSIDGPEAVHDEIRGRGVFRTAVKGVRALRAKSSIKLITNTTLNRINATFAADTAVIAGDLGCTFAAFHPFETSAEIDNSIELSAAETVNAAEEVRDAFIRGQSGSVVLESEASRFDVILEMFERGWFSDMELLADDTGFLFFGTRTGHTVLLVNVMAYPHHYIRTIRVADNGGLSSCRSMARAKWVGVGDLRYTPLMELLRSEEVLQSLALIWSEFRTAVARCPSGRFRRFLELLATRAEMADEPSPPANEDLALARVGSVR